MESEMAKGAHFSPTSEDLCSRGTCNAFRLEGDHAARWRRITELLAACGRRGGKAGECTSRRRVVAGVSSFRECSGRNAAIQILERPTPTSAVLSWRDPTGSSYGYQVWQKRIAKRAGNCALTGLPIRRGDPVFRPKEASVSQANAAAMILAVYIERPQRIPSRLRCA
jgi:hypothetical protein